MANEFIYAENDVLVMLDTLLGNRAIGWWDGFYEDRAKPCPFFTESPDESLAEWCDAMPLHPGQALDLGCGHARNAIFLAGKGFAVEGVDYSETAINWAKERVAAAGVAVQLRHQSVFDLKIEAGCHDLVYDSGCFHHLPPHRRRTYVELATRALTVMKSGRRPG